jgi:competence protein ComEC
MGMRRFQRGIRGVFIWLLLLLLLLLNSQAIAGMLNVHFIDVGQGDAILIQSPNGKTMLIDGGDAKKDCVRKLLDYMLELQINTVDILIATHPHVDHLGGLLTVLEHFSVSQVYDSGKIHETNVFHEYLSIIDEKNIPFAVLRRGNTIDFDPEVEVLVLHPVGEVGLPNLPVNDCSIVLKITYGNIQFLLTGDIGVAVEEKLVREGFSIDSDILKLSHHGSRYASSPEFLDKVSPSIAIISVGIDNSYGHPHDEVLESLAEQGVTIFLTSVDGTITVQTDGEGIIISTTQGKHLDISKPDEKGLLNINTATQAELETLPRIGPVLAERIINYRELHGKFKDITETMNVSGIGKATFEQIKDLITVE